jgi:hypothetical protein
MSVNITSWEDLLENETTIKDHPAYSKSPTLYKTGGPITHASGNKAHF